MKLNRIGFRSTGKDKPISALQLSFTNKVESPLIETVKGISQEELLFEDIDTSKDIRKITMQVKSGFINKIRFVDSEGKSILEWGCQGSIRKEWMTCEVPEGKEIIGIFSSLTPNTH